ncbi:MAG: hypothetical protein HC869_17295 [Rhodospirillales bacterium]|nr:hypothetical protein [Rhodospirillales bacterium]
MKAKQDSATMPAFDARARYDVGLSDIADESKLQSVTDLEPHVVFGRMMWMGVR